MEANKLETNFFLALLLVVGILTFFMFLPYMTALVFAITLAVVFYPVYGWVLKKVKNGHLASAIIVFCVILLVIFPLLYFGYTLFNEARNLYLVSESGASPLLLSLEKAGNNLKNFLPNAELDLKAGLQKTFGWFVSNLGKIFSSLANMFLSFAIALFALFFFLKDGHKLKAFITKQSPLSVEHNNMILDRLGATLNSVVRGTLIVAVVQGGLLGLGFWLLGIPTPVFWGALGVFAALIPAVGMGAMIVPAVAYLYFTGHTLGALGLLLWGIFVVGLIDNFLRPYLIEREVKIHPLIIFLSVLGGLKLFGPIGFLAGPLLISLFFTLLSIHSSLFPSREAKS